MSMRAEVMPPPSPAGGNYLALDGVEAEGKLATLWGWLKQ